MKGARQGCMFCESNIGMIYKHGDGVEKNIDTALEWFTKSAEKGNAIAQNSAGRILYDEGQYQDAFKWFTKSAAQGYTYAQSNLAKCYEDGKGVKKGLRF